MSCPCVLGLELGEAMALLTAAGFAVSDTEVRSRKGVDGEEKRVIRQRPRADGGIALCWSVFKTDVAR